MWAGPHLPPLVNTDSLHHRHLRFHGIFCDNQPPRCPLLSCIQLRTGIQIVMISDDSEVLTIQIERELTDGFIHGKSLQLLSTISALCSLQLMWEKGHWLKSFLTDRTAPTPVALALLSKTKTSETQAQTTHTRTQLIHSIMKASIIRLVHSTAPATFWDVKRETVEDQVAVFNEVPSKAYETKESPQLLSCLWKWVFLKSQLSEHL